MKRIYLIALIPLFVACSKSIVVESERQELDAFKYAAEKQLNYLVDFKGEKYAFVVQTEQVNPDLVFTYLMSNQKETLGKITITANALENAKQLWNYFGNEEVVLEKYSSVWLSKAMYNSIKASDSIRLKINPINYDNFYSTEHGICSLEVNGTDRPFNFLVIKSSKGNYLKIVDDVDFPLILEMDLGWTIKFKEAFY